MEIVKNAENAKIFDCSNCLYVTCNKSDYTRHISTRKHKKRVFGNVFYAENAENAEIHECSVCLFISSNKTDYNRHMSTLKHQKEVTNLETKNEYLFCNCGKQYTF